MNLIQNEDKNIRIIGLCRKLAKSFLRNTFAAPDSDFSENKDFGFSHNWGLKSKITTQKAPIMRKMANTELGRVTMSCIHHVPSGTH